MERTQLLEALSRGDAMEESIVLMLTQILSFYTDRQDDIPEKNRLEIKGLLTILTEDCRKHRRYLEETKDLIYGVDSDDI